MIKFGLSIEDDDEAEDVERRVEELYVYVCAYCLLSFEGRPDCDRVPLSACLWRSLFSRCE